MEECLLLERGAALLEKINKVRESSNDRKQQRDERITGVGDRRVVNHLALNNYSPGGLQGKWKHHLLLWSIAKCLPGICLFNPLSKAIWACSVGGRPAAHRKSWLMEAGYMWTRHAHRPTQPWSRVETHAQILLMRTLAIVRRTADVNTFSNKHILPLIATIYRGKFSWKKKQKTVCSNKCLW